MKRLRPTTGAPSSPCRPSIALELRLYVGFPIED
jgi:hypothetical protein